MTIRSIIAYLLFLAIMLPTLSPWGTIAYFNINRAYIARVLCENRARPKLNCNGKCYLAKKLKQQQDKKDKETTERVENTPIVQLFFAALSGFTFLPLTSFNKSKIRFRFQQQFYSSHLSPLFRPPQTI
jgi:hypothetical protein